MKAFFFFILISISTTSIAQVRYSRQSATFLSFDYQIPKGIGFHGGYEYILPSSNHSIEMGAYYEDNNNLIVLDNKIAIKSAGFTPSYRYTLNIARKVNIGFSIGAVLGWEWSQRKEIHPGTYVEHLINFTPGGRFSIESEYILSEAISMTIGVSEKIVDNALKDTFRTSINIGLRYFF